MNRLITYGIMLCIFLGCKKSDELPTITEKSGIYDFKVEGVPDENITTWLAGGIAIHLPADYQGGDKIKVSFRNSQQVLSEDWALKQGWKNGSVTYE